METSASCSFTLRAWCVCSMHSYTFSPPAGAPSFCSTGLPAVAEIEKARCPRRHHTLEIDEFVARCSLGYKQPVSEVYLRLVLPLLEKLGSQSSIEMFVESNPWWEQAIQSPSIFQMLAVAPNTKMTSQAACALCKAQYSHTIYRSTWGHRYFVAFPDHVPSSNLPCQAS